VALTGCSGGAAPGTPPANAPSQSVPATAAQGSSASQTSAPATSPATRAPAPGSAAGTSALGAYVPALACDIKGAPVLAKGVNLFADAQGTTAIAGFTGQPVSMIATGFPAAGGGGRVRVRTSSGLRFEGFVEASELPLYTAAEIPVVPGHVWIAQGQRAAFSGASNAITVEVPLTGPVTQTFRVTAPCSSLGLDRRQRNSWDVPGNGRGYLPEKNSLDLHDQPGTNVIQTIRVATEPGSGMLLWSTETQGGYVHVVYHEDLVIDAWVASTDLSALKQGETMDRLAPPQAMIGAARLSVGGQPTLVRAEKPVPLRLTPDDAAKPIGTIETGGEVYLIQTVLGWTSVLPRALNLLPPGDRSFWVPTSEVGTAK